MADQGGVPGGMGQTPGGIYAPQTAIQSAGMAEGTPQVRPSSTIKSYGSHSGTNPTQRFLEQQTDTNQKLTSAIGDMSNMSKEVAANMAEMKKVLESLVAPMDKTKNKIEDWVEGVKDVVDGVGDVEDAVGDMYRQLQKVSRLKIQDPKDIKAIVDGLETLKDEMTEIGKKKLLDKKSLEAVEKLVEGVSEAIVELKDNLDNVDSASSAFDTLKSKLKGVKKDVGQLSFKSMTDEMSHFDKTANSALGGLLGNLRILDGFALKGFMGRLAGTARAFKSFKDEAKQISGERKERIGRALGKHFLGKKIDDKGNVVTSKDVSSMLEGATSKNMGLAFNKMTKEEQDKVVRAVSGRTGNGIGSRLDRKLTASALKSGGGGDSLLLGGAVVEGGGSALAGVMSEVASAAKMLRGPLMILTAGFEAWDLVTAKNKKTYEALGKGGLIAGQGTSLKDMYRGMGQQLTPAAGLYGVGDIGTGTAVGALGMSFERNLDLMKGLVEHGLTVDVPDRNAVQALNGGGSGRAANSMFSGVMRNAYLFGGNVGMNDQESIKTMMDMVFKFNQSIKQTEDFFINIDKSVKATGISTTKYLQLVDQITSQFDKFNKSLTNSVAIIQTLGKSGKYTAEYLQGMLGSMTGEKKSFETNAYLFKQMSPESKDTFVNSQKILVKSLGDELTSVLGKNPENMKDEDVRDAVDRYTKTPGVSKNDAKAVQEQAAQYLSSRGRVTAFEGAKTPIEMAAVVENMGEDLQSRVASQIIALNDTIHKSTGGGIGDMADMNKKAAIMRSPMYTVLGKTLGISGEQTQKYLGDALHEVANDVKDAIEETNPEEKEKKAAKLGTTVENLQNIKAQRDQGVDIMNTKGFNDIFTNMGGIIAEKITEEERKAAVEKAVENRKYITGPLDYIQRTLGQMLESLVEILRTIVDYFFKDEAKTQQDAWEWSRGNYNGGETFKEVKDLKKNANDQIENLNTAGLDKDSSKKYSDDIAQATDFMNEYLKMVEEDKNIKKEYNEAYSELTKKLKELKKAKTTDDRKKILDEIGQMLHPTTTVDDQGRPISTNDVDISAAGIRSSGVEKQNRMVKGPDTTVQQHLSDEAQKAVDKAVGDADLQALVTPSKSLSYLSDLPSITSPLSLPKNLSPGVTFNQFNNAEVVTGTTVASQPTNKGGETSFPSPFLPQGVK